MELSYDAYSDGLNLLWSGSLSPGNYTLSLESHASGSVIESSSTSFVGQFKVAIQGDFNIDCQLTAEDIDLLAAAVRDGKYESLYDLDQNKLLDQEDQRIWVEELKRTYFGDTDLDGEFNSDDIVAVFEAGLYEDTISDNSTWVTGDWDGDGEAASGDFVLALQGGGYETGPRPDTAWVPEPSSGLLLLLGLAQVLRKREKASGVDTVRHDFRRVGQAGSEAASPRTHGLSPHPPRTSGTTETAFWWAAASPPRRRVHKRI